ncbi:MAG: hypothetical protein HQM13_20340 [SAR324 cluster bacterium]|nr:hypothetical protein [SAR324 cluster bacterium]
MRALPTWKEFFALSLLKISTRAIRINWGILEELESQGSPFAITCSWSQTLYCFSAFKKHRFPLIEISNQGSLESFFNNWGVSVRQAPNASASDEEWRLFWETTDSRSPLWIPADEHQAGERSMGKMVAWIQKNEIPLVPVGFTSLSDPIYPLSAGLRFPYPFSRVGLWVGTPIRLENFPVDQACLEIKQALHFPDELSRALLLNMQEMNRTF